MIKNLKIQIVYFFIFIFAFYIVLSLSCYCYEKVEVINITKEDIQNAKPVSPYVVNLTEKDLRIIETMEKRHFPRTYPEFSDKERIKNLEYELMGRIFEYTPQDIRIRRLKLASSNTAIIGTALPASISSKRNAKRMRNSSIELRKRDNVGLIDGFLRLVSPEKYEQFRNYSDNRFNNYEY